MTFTGRDLLKKLEACRLNAYQDGAGVWTIGYGHTGPDVRPGLIWSQAQADAALDRDLLRFDNGVRQLLGGVELTDAQFSAFVIFAYNIGLSAFMGSTALRNARLGLLEQVPPAIKLWNKITDHSGVHVLSPGLVKRRQAEADLWSET